MHVFVTGGSGLTGPAVISELIAAGHTVTGLARSDGAAARLEALGATPLPGSLQDLDRLLAGAGQCDGVIHMGVPSVSLTFDEAVEHCEQASEHFGSTFLATILAADVPVSSDLTRALTHWEPAHYTLLEDLRRGDYITPGPA
jgi:uncharacterized protein YbjT (DUF2867 family)